MNEGDYLVFGHFYGMCVGDGCVSTYKLTDDALFKDLNHNYSGTDFDFETMSPASFESVKDLMEHIPSALLNENEAIIGCPDCADQGGLLIQYSKNGRLKSWRMDQNKNNVPNYLHSFIDKVNAKINLINN